MKNAATGMHRSALLFLAFVVAGLCVGTPAISAAAEAQTEVGTPIVFEDVRVLDTRTGRLSARANVLVRGNRIERIATGPVSPELVGAALVIQGGGRTLMPGLIDAHAHVTMATMPPAVFMSADIGYINLVAAKEARDTLMRGFTSIRDLSGPSFSIKRGIDEGLIEGPRIWPSGAMISQTAGHGDFRMPYEIPAPANAPPSHGEAINAGVIADGPDEVRKRVREQLMLGASQIKLAAGGGVSSNYDPLDVAQYTEAEFRAAVEAAENWGTYVTVHAYTPRAIQTAIRGGVKVIDHGQLIDDATARIMADQGIWLSLQPFLDDEDAIPFADDSENRRKQLQMTQGTDNAYALARRHNLKTAWGTDTLFDANLAKRQNAQLAKMVRWYAPAEVIRMATLQNAELLALSGARSPYPGVLGLVEEGALADLLLVDGDPIADLTLIENPERNFVVIMKNGRIYKNLLD